MSVKNQAKPWSLVRSRNAAAPIQCHRPDSVDIKERNAARRARREQRKRRSR